MARPGRLFLLLALFVVVAAAAQTPPCDLKPYMPPSKDEEAFEKALYVFLEGNCYAGWAHDKDLRDTGPNLFGWNLGTHPAVRIYYSKEAVEWMETPKDKRGEMPDNAVIIKQMHNPPAGANNPVRLSLQPRVDLECGRGTRADPLGQ